MTDHTTDRDRSQPHEGEQPPAEDSAESPRVEEDGLDPLAPGRSLFTEGDAVEPNEPA